MTIADVYLTRSAAGRCGAGAAWAAAIQGEVG